METTMTTNDWLRKLRARVAELKRKRVKLLAKYDRDFEAWKKEAAEWCKTTLPSRLKDVKKYDMHGYRRIALPDHVFKDMPSAPRKPDDRLIREIQKTIRFLDVTSAKKVQVSRTEVNEWFTNEDEEEDGTDD